MVIVLDLAHFGNQVSKFDNVGMSIAVREDQFGVQWFV